MDFLISIIGGFVGVLLADIVLGVVQFFIKNRVSKKIQKSVKK